MSIGFETQINQGILPTDIEPQDKELFEQLIDMGALELRDGLYKLNSLYRTGRLYIDKNSRGYIEAPSKDLKDLIDKLENDGYSVYFREVKFGLDEGAYMYELHII